MKFFTTFLIYLLFWLFPLHLFAQETTSARLTFEVFPGLPDPVGVAGPIVGIIEHGNQSSSVRKSVLIVAGGANFAPATDPKLWELPKLYHDDIWLMELNSADEADIESKEWKSLKTKLSRNVAYSSSVRTPWGLLCVGGEDSDGATNRTFLLSATIDNGVSVVENDAGIPDLPLACTAGGAAVIGNYVYVVAGQVTDKEGNRAASRTVWRMDLTTLQQNLESDVNREHHLWKRLPAWPTDGPRRMFAQVATQHDGFGDRLYVIGGRRFLDGSDPTDVKNLEPTVDGWSFDPSQFDESATDQETGQYSGKSPWKRIADSPVPLTAGTAIPYGPAHIIVPSYATLDTLKEVLNAGIEMKDFTHPGFPKQAYAYHTITDSWTNMGSTPSNQVTTQAVRWKDDILLVSGEVRPRVRTNKSWRIRPRELKSEFGWINLSVVATYLLAMLGIGVYFSFRNKSTDDYFRGGMNIPWWAAGCSIFATMLSSITYMAVPAKAFAQDWVYAIGSLLILGVAPIAIYIALPFFRRIDATSAYEYLEKRFNRTLRLIGSGSFSLFHVFRMGVVLALASLALASVTPLTPTQCVYVMGGLSIIYCTLGGIEAVIWTDTLQTFVLLGGAGLCLAFAIMGSEPGSFNAAVHAGKFHMINFDFGSTSFSAMAIWVVILGGFGQNVASYTADQAVVQRYMTTADKKLAARSIWLNGLMAIPAAIIFFGMGTSFWMFYHSNPEKLDPTIAADRIMPLFISHELPVGLAGLVVAGIFAAAQSTVSTSMNSGATTIVTDFVRSDSPKSDRAKLWMARIATFAMGILGTLAGLFFVDPSIKSLFDQFIGILGMFLGVLAGLFALGATTQKASSTGSLIGAFVSILFMIAIVFASKDISLMGLNFKAIFDTLGTRIYMVNGYLYAFIGISVCYFVGYLASLPFPDKITSLQGLTLWDPPNPSESAKEEPTSNEVE